MLSSIRNLRRFYISRNMATRKQLKENFLTCSVCTEVFKDPVTLHCGHTFCIQCVTSYIKTKRQAVVQKVLPCANCRQMTPVPDPAKPVDEWASQLKTGFFVKGLVDAIVSAGKGTAEYVASVWGPFHETLVTLRSQTQPSPESTMRLPDSEKRIVVFDNGTSMFKGGFAGEEEPRAVFPTVVGHKYIGGLYSTYIGDAAVTEQQSVALKYPVEHGIITNWDDMEKIWHHAFHECGVDPKDYSVLLTTSALSSGKEHEKVTEVMFEKFNVRKMFLCHEGPLSLFGYGFSTGLVVGSGGGTTWTAPVVKCQLEQHAISTQKRGGHEITYYLKELLKSRGFDDDLQTMQNIKESIVYTALDAKGESDIYRRTPLLSRTFTKPDGHVINVGTEVFMSAESMFKPSLLGVQADGIHEMIYKSIMKCEECVQDELFAHIVLAGGNTMFPGMSTRIAKEIRVLSPNKRVKVISHPSGKYSAWTGGSTLADLGIWQGLWVTKEQYEESGCTIVHKCVDRYNSLIK